NVIECGPMNHQVTVPPTGILTVFNPNSSTEPEPTGVPEPASTGFGPGSVRFGTGGLPCRRAATGPTSGFSAAASCFSPMAYWADGLMIVLLDGTTAIFPCMPSRCRAHMNRYVPGEIAPDRRTVQLWSCFSQPLLKYV